jgi:hypothetical protein
MSMARFTNLAYLLYKDLHDPLLKSLLHGMQAVTEAFPISERHRLTGSIHCPLILA